MCMLFFPRMIFFAMFIFAIACGGEAGEDTYSVESALGNPATQISLPKSYLKLPGNSLEEIRQRIRQIAKCETGHHDRDSYEPAGRYYAYGGEWCSEFVSWVYHFAGVPFEGGKAGLIQYSRIEWILETTKEIITYFQKYKAFAYIDELKPDAQPEIGDYVYITHGSWKHSAILYNLLTEENGVETMVTIDGNHHNDARVQLHWFPNWRTAANEFGDRVSGIGFLRLSEAGADAADD